MTRKMNNRTFNSFIRVVLAVAALIVVTVSNTVAGELMVAFNKSFAPDAIGPGSTSTLTFTITNTDQVTPVSDMAFSDTLPASVTIATPANATTDCTNAILDAPDGGGTITFSNGQLSPSSSCTVILDVTSPTPGIHTNTSGDLTSSVGNSGSATADLTVSASLPGFNKSFGPGSIPLGGTSTLTFNIDNTANSSDVSTSLAFSDMLPAGMVIATPANVFSNCGTAPFVPFITATSGTNTISFNISGSASFPVVGAGSSCSIDVDVTTNATGLFANTSGQLFSGQESAAIGFATAQLDVPVKFLVKSFTDDPVLPGDTVTLEFTLTNLDRDDPATGISFSDDLDITLTGLLATGLPFSACGGAVSTPDGGMTIEFSGGSLAAAEICPFSVVLDVPSGATPGSYSNTTSGVLFDPENFEPGATDELVVTLAPTFTKEFLTNPVGAGGTTTLRFTITNNSTDTLDDIAFVDVLNDVLPTASVVPANPVCNGGTAFYTPFIDGSFGSPNEPARFTVTGASLGASESCTIDITLDVVTNATEGTYPNSTGPITGLLGGSEPVEGFPASDDLVVIGGPSLIKEFTDDPIAPGDPVTLEFTLSHSEFAAAGATAIGFTDDLTALTPAIAGLAATGLPLTEACDPDGAGGSPGTGTLSGTTVLTFSGASLAPGESCTFSVALSVPGSALAGSHANETSIVTATVGGIAVTGNPATDDLKIDGLILTKEFTDDPVIPGDTVDLKFTIENTSAGETATAIVFQDDMDNILGGVPSITGDGVTVNDVCGAGNGTVSWSAANTRMTFSGGTLAPSAICVFTVTLNVPAAAASGTYVNSTGGGASLVFSASMSGSGGTVAFDEASDELIVASDFLSLTKEFTDDPVLPGGTVTLEFTLTNLDGAQTASDIAFTDDLDTALTGLVATVLPSAGTACNGTGTLAGTGLLTFTGGSLAAGASCSFSATLTVPPSTFPSSYVNATGGVTGTMGGLAVTGDPATDDLVVASVLPIFSKTFTDDPVSPGGSVTLEFVITNPDSVNAATGIAFTDDLAAVVPDLVAIGLPQNDVCGAGSSLSGAGLLTFTGGLLAADSSCTFSVTLEVSAFALLRTSTNNTSRLSTAELGDAVDPASDDITVAGDVILLDTDGDGITDVVEILLGLNPNDPDTDADGTPDGLEDGDGDGVSNIGELGLGFDPDNTGSTPTPTYPDVDGLHPQFLEIEILTAKGFFSGCDGTNFCPNEIIVRDAAAIPLSLAFNEAAGFGLPVGATGTVFDDILAGEFGADEVEDLQANGVSVGCAGTAGLPGFLYCPNQVVTKSSAALMLLTAESIATGGAIPVAGTSPFADVLLGDFAADAIIELFARGHTEGCDGNAITPPTLFCPHEAMTKASFAKLLVWVFGLTPP